MKTKFTCIDLAAILLAGVIGSGCANAHDAAKTEHHIEYYGAAVGPGWTVIEPNITNGLNQNQFSGFSVIPPAGTTALGFCSSLVTQPRFFKAYSETWVDKSRGGGTFVLTDPQASQLSFTRSNQNGLGGTRAVGIGSISSTITTNAVSVISATGTAVGNVVGAAASAAAK